MPRLISRVLAALGMAFGLYVNSAAAGVGAMGSGVLSAFGSFAPVQTVQAGQCWNPNGPDGPGYYPCGDGVGGPIGGPVGGTSIIRPDRHGAGGVSAPPAPLAQPPALAGVHEGIGAGGHVGAPATPGVASNIAAMPHIAAPPSPGAVAGPAEAPHIGAPASHGLAGAHNAVPAGGIGHR